MESVGWPQYILAMFVLFGLLGSLGLFAFAVQRGWILKTFTGFQHFAPAERRLSITESQIIDPRRRVIIVKCDDVEHVVLLGAESETVLATQPAKPKPPTPLASSLRDQTS